jgi:hypothetical protein
MTTASPPIDIGERSRRDQAMCILCAAQTFNIHVGTDGDSLVMVAPMRVPSDVRRWFENELHKYKAEAIEIIQNRGGS